MIEQIVLYLNKKQKGMYLFACICFGYHEQYLENVMLTGHHILLIWNCLQITDPKVWTVRLGKQVNSISFRLQSII